MQTRAEKQQQVEDLREKVRRATSLVLVDYRGLTVDESNELRAALRKAGDTGVEYRVAKNTLMRLATQGTPFEGISRYLNGPTAVAFAYDEPAAMARALVDYAKNNAKLGIKGGALDGEIVDLAGIEQLAKLPSKHELRGMLAGTLQAPLRNLAGTLQSLLGNLRNALDQRAKQLEAQ